MRPRWLATAASLVVLCAAVAARPARADDRYPEAPNGLYPLWENNAYVREHRRAVLGWNDAQFGIGGYVHIGTQPSALVFRMPNLQLKVRLYRSRTLQVAAQVGVYVLFPGAADALLSTAYASPLANPDFYVAVVPVSLAFSFRPTRWLALHHTLTVLTNAGGPLRAKASLGNFLTLELLALRHHSVFLHLANVGLWREDLSVVGASYRFTWRWLEARIGYAYRHTPDGWQGLPLIGGGLLF